GCRTPWQVSDTRIVVSAPAVSSAWSRGSRRRIDLRPRRRTTNSGVRHRATRGVRPQPARRRRGGAPALPGAPGLPGDEEPVTCVAAATEALELGVAAERPHAPRAPVRHGDVAGLLRRGGVEDPA